MQILRAVLRMGPGAVEEECERGVWYPVACSKQLALKQVIQLPKPLWRGVSELVGGEMEAESRRAYGEATKEGGKVRRAARRQMMSFGAPE